MGGSSGVMRGGEGEGVSAEERPIGWATRELSYPVGRTSDVARRLSRTAAGRSPGKVKCPSMDAKSSKTRRFLASPELRKILSNLGPLVGSLILFISWVIQQTM